MRGSPGWIVWLALGTSCGPAAPDDPAPDGETDADADADTDADVDADTDADADTAPPDPGSLFVLRGPDALAAGSPTEVTGFGGIECGDWAAALADGVLVHCTDPEGSLTEGLLHHVDGAALLDGVAEVRATLSGVFVAGDSPVAVPGDLDGDGLGEIGVRSGAGSGTDLGRVLPGSTWAGDTTLGDVAWRLLGEDGHAPLAPEVVGDTDGDGVSDLVVVQTPSSYVDETSVGTRVYVVSGAALAGTAEGAQVNVPALAGRTVVATRALGAPRVAAGVGDLDGDGLTDVAIAFGPEDEPGADQAGDVRLVLSSRADTSLDAGPAVRGVQVGRLMGTVLAPLGDLDGDGRDELAVGFVVEGDEGSSSRHLELGVVHGSDVALDGDTVLSPWDADLQGYSGVACDLDGDGAKEWITADGIWAGTELLAPTPSPVAAGLDALACLGDLDGDGAEELAF